MVLKGKWGKPFRTSPHLSIFTDAPEGRYSFPFPLFHFSAEGITTLTYQVPQVRAQLVVATSHSIDLPNDVGQDHAVSQLSQDLLVPVAQLVHVVRMALELIQSVQQGSLLHCPWANHSCMFPCRSDYIIGISAAFRFRPLGRTLLSSAYAAFR